MRLVTSLAALALLCSVSLVHAAGVTSFGDATIFKSKNDLDAGGVAGVVPAADHLFIGGDGIDNGGFTLLTDVDKGLQLGLRGKERFVNNALPNDGDHTYFGVTGDGGGGTASWNVDFHVDLGANLATLVPFGDVKAPGPLTGTAQATSVILELDFDPGIGTVFVPVDLYASAIVQGGATSPLLIQDSQNIGFAFWQGAPFNAPAFDPNAVGQYDFRLTALAGSTNCGSVEIHIVVDSPTPVEHSSWGRVKSLYR